MKASFPGRPTRELVTNSFREAHNAVLGQILRVAMSGDLDNEPISANVDDVIGSFGEIVVNELYYPRKEGEKSAAAQEFTEEMQRQASAISQEVRGSVELLATTVCQKFDNLLDLYQRQDPNYKKFDVFTNNKEEILAALSHECGFDTRRDITSGYEQAITNEYMALEPAAAMEGQDAIRRTLENTFRAVKAADGSLFTDYPGQRNALVKAITDRILDRSQQSPELLQDLQTQKLPLLERAVAQATAFLEQYDQTTKESAERLGELCVAQARAHAAPELAESEGFVVVNPNNEAALHVIRENLETSLGAVKRAPEGDAWSYEVQRNTLVHATIDKIMEQAQRDPEVFSILQTQASQLSGKDIDEATRRSLLNYDEFVETLADAAIPHERPAAAEPERKAPPQPGPKAVKRNIKRKVQYEMRNDTLRYYEIDERGSPVKDTEIYSEIKDGKLYTYKIDKDSQRYKQQFYTPTDNGWYVTYSISGLSNEGDKEWSNPVSKKEAGRVKDILGTLKEHARSESTREAAGTLLNEEARLKKSRTRRSGHVQIQLSPEQPDLLREVEELAIRTRNAEGRVNSAATAVRQEAEREGGRAEKIEKTLAEMAKKSETLDSTMATFRAEMPQTQTTREQLVLEQQALQENELDLLAALHEQNLRNKKLEEQLTNAQEDVESMRIEIEELRAKLLQREAELKQTPGSRESAARGLEALTELETIEQQLNIQLKQAEAATQDRIEKAEAFRALLQRVAPQAQREEARAQEEKRQALEAVKEAEIQRNAAAEGQKQAQARAAQAQKEKEEADRRAAQTRSKLEEALAKARAESANATRSAKEAQRKVDELLAAQAQAQAPTKQAQDRLKAELEAAQGHAQEAQKRAIELEQASQQMQKEHALTLGTMQQDNKRIEARAQLAEEQQRQAHELVLKAQEEEANAKRLVRDAETRESEAHAIARAALQGEKEAQQREGAARQGEANALARQQQLAEALAEAQRREWLAEEEIRREREAAQQALDIVQRAPQQAQAILEFADDIDKILIEFGQRIVGKNDAEIARLKRATKIEIQGKINALVRVLGVEGINPGQLTEASAHPAAQNFQLLIGGVRVEQSMDNVLKTLIGVIHADIDLDAASGGFRDALDFALKKIVEKKGRSRPGEGMKLADHAYTFLKRAAYFAVAVTTFAAACSVLATIGAPVLNATGLSYAVGGPGLSGLVSALAKTSYATSVISTISKVFAPGAAAGMSALMSYSFAALTAFAATKTVQGASIGNIGGTVGAVAGGIAGGPSGAAAGATAGYALGSGATKELGKLTAKKKVEQEREVEDFAIKLGKQVNIFHQVLLNVKLRGGNRGQRGGNRR